MQFIVAATTIMVCAEIFIREIVFAFFAKFFSRKLFSQNSVSFSHFFSLNSFSRNNAKFNEKVCETNENYRFFSLLCFMRFSVFQKFQGCVSGVSGLCLKRFRVVTQEIQCCVSGVSGFCLKRFRVVFQEIQGYVSRVSGCVSRVSGCVPKVSMLCICFFGSEFAWIDYKRESLFAKKC